MTPPLHALAGALALALVHVFAGRIRFLTYVPRSAWLSAAGGASVAYVFIHLLPELGAAQSAVSHAVPSLVLLAERHVYVIALVGLLGFYGMDSLALHARRRSRERGDDDRTPVGVYRVHMASFTLYNGLIGYLLIHRERSTTAALVLYTVAMGLHFVVNDAGLREHHKDPYDHRGRWVLAGAILGGWAVGLTGRIHEAAIATLVAFLSGGVILNVLKEEVPEGHHSRFDAFALGLAAYTVILLAI